MPTAPKTIRMWKRRLPDQLPMPQRVEHRPNSHQRGYTEAWKRASKAWLMEQFAQGNVHCGECGKPLMGERRDIHVDHIVDHKGDMDRFWDQSNWQALHAACHSRKTARENGIGR